MLRQDLAKLTASPVFTLGTNFDIFLYIEDQLSLKIATFPFKYQHFPGMRFPLHPPA